MARPTPRLRARAAIAVLAAVATAGAVLGIDSVAPASANVTVHEVYTIPTTGASAGKFTILWRGNGHGHGLSQYGAKGAAEKGLGFAKILSFYYPGTTQATASGNMRVLLSSVPRDSIQVKPTSTLTVIDTGNGNAVTALPTTIGGAAVKQWRLGVNAQGRAVVSYLQSAWKSYKTLIGDGEFIDHGLTYVTLLNPTTERFHGGLLAASAVPHDLHRYAVNVVNLEQYVDGVVASEMPSSWPQPALRAQAIAARTYGLFERAENAGNYYDICDSTWCQVYGGMGAEAAASTQAVTATKGIYLAYQGRPAFTQFSSSNGGWESYGGQPYLPSKADPYTPTAQQVYGRDYSWSKSNISVAPLQSAYPSIGTLKSITITSREGGTGATWQGRVMSMTLNGSKGSQVISGDTFEAIFGLTSTWFTLEVAAPASTAPKAGTPQTYAVGSHVKPGWTASLGQPTGPEVTTTAFGVTGYYQKFPKGYAIISSKFGTFVSNGLILAHWSPSANGWPISGISAQTAFGLRGWVQRYQGGRAIIASRYGTFSSSGSAFATWRASARGWPTADLRSTTYRGRSGWLQTFSRAASGPDYVFVPRATGVPAWSNGSPS